MPEEMRHEHPGDEGIPGSVPSGRVHDPPAKRDARKKRKALLDSIEELKGCIDYIDWKQDFYAAVLAGEIPYVSNLIRTEQL